MIPDVLSGRYRVVREIGRGGMGLVLFVRDEAAGRDVALKLLQDREYSDSGLRHFEQEFRTLTALSHPALPEVFDFGRLRLPDRDSVVPFFTMEFVAGQHADRFLAGEPVDFPAVTRVLAQLLEALAYLHAHGFVHQDVKPSNLLVSGDRAAPRVKLMDLGLAGPPREGAGPGRIRGTAAYLSPEAARGDAVDPRADLYAVGCVAYELVTGRAPFSGATPLSVVRGHLVEPPLPPRSLNRDVPAPLEAFILRLLEKDPGRRPASADRALEQLDRSAGGTLVGAPADRRFRALGGGFTGRQAEVERIRAAIAAASRGGAAWILISGEAGIGKSRLLREAQVLAQLDGGEVFAGRPSLADALAQALRARGPLPPEIEERHGGALARFLGTGEPEIDDDRSGASFEIPGAVAAALACVARGAPVLLAVDDLHAADETTCACLAHLATQAPAGVVVLGACRDDGLARRTPLSEATARCRESGRLEELVLGPLGAADTAAILRSRLGVDDVPDSFLARVVEDTRGNPLHLGELVALLVQEGHVRPGSGVPLDPDALARLEIPSRIRDLGARRIEALEPGARRVLEALATLGEEGADLDAIAAVAETKWETASRQLAELEHAGLVVRRDADGEEAAFRCAHRGIAEILDETTPPERMRRLHEQALSYLERRGVPRRHDAWRQLARHAERAGRAGRAIEAWGRAGDLAREIHASREAIAAWSRAIELAQRQPDAPAPLLCSLYERRSAQHALAGDAARAEEDARWMLARAEKGGQDALRARAHVRLGEALGARERADEAIESLEVAAAIAERLRDTEIACAAHAGIGRAHAAAGRGEEALRSFERAQARASEAGLVAREVDALVAQGALLRERGDFKASLARYEAAASRAGRRAGAAAEIVALEGAALALEVQGRYREAIAAYATARDRARERGDAATAAALTLALGSARARLADDAGARAEFEDALEQARRLDSRELAVRAHACVAALEVRRGNYDAALEAAHEALRRARRPGGRPDLEAEALHGAGRVHLRLGDRPGAGTALVEAERLSRDSHLPRLSAAIVGDLSELRRLEGNAVEARRLAQEAAFLARRAGDRRLEAAGLARLGEAHLLDNDWDRARVAASKALGLVEGSGAAVEEAEALALRARIALGQPGGDVVQSEADALEALQRLRDAGEADALGSVEHLAARAAGRLGRRTESLERLARARASLEQFRSRVPSRWREAWSSDPRRRDLEEEWSRSRPAAPGGDDAAPSDPGPASEVSRLRRENAALKRLLDALRGLGAERDPERLAEAVVATAVELTRAERGFLLERRADGGIEVRAASGPGAGSPSSAIAARAFDSGAAVLATDAASDHAWTDASSVAELGIRSVVAVPVRAGPEVNAVLYLDHRGAAAIFDAAHVEIASRLGEQVALALAAARLVARLEDQRETLDRLNLELERTAAEQRAELADARERIAASQSSLELRYAFEQLVGASPLMQRLYHRIERLAPKRLPVLVVGESGTGKELVARALHARSDRSGGPFFTVNCAALPENLLESELFGYRKGAFTGADRNKPGYFELAHGGTLFLDEIGEMGAAMQAKLLRVLQEGEVLPVGGHAPIRVDVRVVSATHRDLAAMIRDGQFREDLFYRIHVARIDVPPLRARREDIPLLVEHTLDRLAEQEEEPRRDAEPELLRRLAEHDWPGNVRELQHQILRLSAFAKGSTLTLRDLERYGDLGDARTANLPATPSPASGVESLEEIERKQIERALEQARGNKTRAAEILGINRATLFRKLRR
ncbi:MAG TPA: sigma 54-interacting transcriptional regulator [Candidatus Polarisedimenticolaceae bacterium]